MIIYADSRNLRHFISFVLFKSKGHLVNSNRSHFRLSFIAAQSAIKNNYRQTYMI